MRIDFRKTALPAFAIFAFISLAPPLLAQKPLPFEKEIRAFEASDRTNPPPKNAVLFVGSSSIRFWPNLAQSFPDLTVIQRGFGGSHLPENTAYADRIIIPYQPSKIVLYAGDNDIARGDSPAAVAAHFREFAQKIRKALPKTEIYYISIKPSPSRWYLSPQMIEANRLIRHYCQTHRGLAFIDVWKAMLDARGEPDPAIFRPDKLHMNAQGYAIWTRIIGKALKGSAHR